MNEMNVETVDRRLVLIKLIEAALGGAPVESVPPITHQIFEICQVGAVVPTGSGNLAGEPCPGQPSFQIGKDRVRHVNLEWSDVCLRRPLRRRCARSRRDGCWPSDKSCKCDEHAPGESSHH